MDHHVRSRLERGTVVDSYQEWLFRLALHDGSRREESWEVATGCGQWFYIDEVDSDVLFRIASAAIEQRKRIYLTLC